MAVEMYAGETMLERWTMRFKPHSGAGYAAGRADPAVYKRMVIALRSLHSFVRVLPAYRLHRTCKACLPSPFYTAHRLE